MVSNNLLFNSCLEFPFFVIRIKGMPFLYGYLLIYTFEKKLQFDVLVSYR
jgi:hypothetical protein